MSRIHHLTWGPDIVFTYGPFAFLQNTGYYSVDQALLATIYQVSTLAALFLGVVAALRRRYPPMTSLFGAFVATGSTAILLGNMYPEVVVLAAFAWASLLLLQDEPKRSTVFTTSVALSAIAGFALLVKFNTGPVIETLTLAMSLLRDWRAIGRHCTTVIAFAASIPIWWMLAGQRLGNLPAWLGFSSQIVSGYIEAQAIPIPLDAVGAVLLSLVWMVAVCVMFVRGGTRIPRRMVVLVAITTVLITKSVFSRYDSHHFSVLLGLMVVTVAITPLVGIFRRAFEVVVITILVAYFAGILVVEQRPVAVAQAPVRAVDRLITFALPGHASRHVEQSKARQRAHYGIPDRFIKTIGSKSVHVDPDEASAAWAYNLAWRPAPVFQTYSAYTLDLDKLNGNTLANQTQFVLSRRSPDLPATGISDQLSVNNRLHVQESPLYARTLLCDYTVSGDENRWALLTRSGNHCGPLTALSEVSVRNGDAVKIPVPSGLHMAVLVGIDLHPTVLDRLFQGAVIPLTTFTVVLDGVGYRLIAGNAVEPFLVTSPASVDGTNLEIHAHTIGIERTRSLGQDGVVAQLRFYKMRVDPSVPSAVSSSVTAAS